MISVKRLREKILQECIILGGILLSFAEVAQLVEHVLGKDGVTSSILVFSLNLTKQRNDKIRHARKYNS